MNRDLRSYNRELVRSIADELGIPEEKVPQLVSKIAELVKPQVGDFVGRRALLAAGIGGLLSLAAASPAAARLTLTDQYIDLDGEKFYPSSVAPYSAIVYKDDNIVKAEDWRGREIARGTAGVDDAEVIQSAVNSISNGKIFVRGGVYNITKTIVGKDGVSISGELKGKHSEQSGVVLKLSVNQDITILDFSKIVEFELERLHIFGYNDNGTYKGTAIKWGNTTTSRAKKAVIKHITIEECDIAIDSPSTTTEDSLIQDVYIRYCNIGINNPHTMISIRDSIIGACQKGVTLQDYGYITLSSCVFSNNSVDISLEGSIDGLVCNGCWFENTQDTIIKEALDGLNIRSIILEGCYINTNNTLIDVTNALKAWIVLIGGRNATETSIKGNQNVQVFIIGTVYQEGISITGGAYVKRLDKKFESSGTATIASGTTSVTVSHGLVSTPSKVIVTPITSLGSASKWWVANITSTTFDIVVDADPQQDVTFAWQAEV